MLLRPASFSFVRPTMIRPYSTQLTEANVGSPLDLFMMQNHVSNQESEGVSYECKKNKATKQAERKRNKRKTGAQINIRFKWARGHIEVKSWRGSEIIQRISLDWIDFVKPAKLFTLWTLFNSSIYW